MRTISPPPESVPLSLQMQLKFLKKGLYFDSGVSFVSVRQRTSQSLRIFDISLSLDLNPFIFQDIISILVMER